MPQDLDCPQRQQPSPGLTGGFGVPVCKVEATADPLSAYIRDLQSGGKVEKVESVSEPETLPASPGNLCARSDDGLSTDLGLSYHS